MRILITALLIAGAPVLALAQAPAPDTKGTTKSSPTASASQPKSTAKASVKTPSKSPALARSAQKAVEEATPVDEDTTTQLTPADLEVARAVHVGDMKCELGASVRITPMRREGFFMVTTKGQRFRMHPAESRTGAIRLEDPRRGAMWLQLGNKSMLMSQKLGQRLADECQSPQQVTQAEFLKINPQPSILDGGGPQRQPGGAASVPMPSAASDGSASTPAAAPAVPDAASSGDAPPTQN